MTVKRTQAQEARTLARKLLHQAGKLRAPKVKTDVLADTLEEIAQRLIDMASKIDTENTQEP